MGIKATQIDHILIAKKALKTVVDYRTLRVVNTDSDHYLVIAKIRTKDNFYKLRKMKDKKYASVKLRNEFKKKYKEDILRYVTH